MTSAIVARVGAHSDVESLAQHSSVPVINALSDDFHPLQALADLMTIQQHFVPVHLPKIFLKHLPGLKVAWIGDCNNVFVELATICLKRGIHVSVASPPGYGIPDGKRGALVPADNDSPWLPGQLTETSDPAEAVKDADVIATDTWVSMHHSDAEKRHREFAGFQVTEELARRGGAKPNWVFMHCMPRHADEVDDNVFYGPRSLVFKQAQNRLWTTTGQLLSQRLPC